MRSRVFTIFAILLVAFIVAALTAPADPFSWCVTAAAVFVASLLCYIVGKRQGRAAPPADLDGNRHLGRSNSVSGRCWAFSRSLRFWRLA